MASLQLDPFYLKNGNPGKRTPLEPSIVKQYAGILPDELLELWSSGGTGSYMNDFFWVVNPKDFQPLVDSIYKPFREPSVVFARDAYGDFFLWEKDCIKFVDVRHSDTEVIGTNAKVFFNHKAIDWNYFSKRVKDKHYIEARQKLGPVQMDECYGYVPILAAGGAEKVENLQKVKLKEHISIILQMAGQID